MRRIAEPWRRRALLAAVAALVPALWACDAQLSAPTEIRTRIFRVTEADGQLLPANHACPAPGEGITAGARFLEGELILYPERTFTWRYTVEQYAASQDSEESWTEPVQVRGTYTVRTDSLFLAPDAGPARRGRILDEGTVELSEPLPCHFTVAGQSAPRASLRLDEVALAR